MVGLVSVLILAVAMVCGTISGLYLLGRPEASGRRWEQGRPRHGASFMTSRLRQTAGRARRVQRAISAQGRHRGRAVAIRQARGIGDWSRAEPAHRVMVSTTVGVGPHTR